MTEVMEAKWQLEHSPEDLECGTYFLRPGDDKITKWNEDEFHDLWRLE